MPPSSLCASAEEEVRVPVLCGEQVLDDPTWTAVHRPRHMSLEDRTEVRGGQFALIACLDSFGLVLPIA